MRFLRSSLFIAVLVASVLGAVMSIAYATPTKQTVYSNSRASLVVSYTRADGAWVSTQIHQCDRKYSDPLAGPTSIDRHVTVTHSVQYADGIRHETMTFETTTVATIPDVLKGARIRETGTGLRESYANGILVSSTPANVAVDLRLAGTGPRSTTSESWPDATDADGNTSMLTKQVVFRSADMTGAASIDGTSIVGPPQSLTATLERTTMVRVWP